MTKVACKFNFIATDTNDESMHIFSMMLQKPFECKNILKIDKWQIEVQSLKSFSKDLHGHIKQ